MKNPFKKEDHNALWIAAAITGALASGLGIWFYLRRNRAAEQEAHRPEHPQDYLKDRQPPHKQHRSDIADLTDIAQHGHA
jgi:hypothetical protein